MTGRKQLTLRHATERTNSPPLQGRGRGWGISASRLATLKERAREMRRNPTEPEKRLWSRLKGSQLGGFKFRRQEIVGSAIVDFACPARWLCVEVDGETHANPEVDALRDRKLTGIGIRVLRFTNQQVMQGLDGVCEAILAELNKPFDRKQAARDAGRLQPSVISEAEGPDEVGLEGSVG